MKTTLKNVPIGWNRKPILVQTQIKVATIKISSDQNNKDDSFRRLNTRAPPLLGAIINAALMRQLYPILVHSNMISKFLTKSI